MLAAGLMWLGAVVNTQACTPNTNSANSANADSGGRFPRVRVSCMEGEVDETTRGIMRL